MDTLTYILSKYNLHDTLMQSLKMPIEIPDVGRNDLASLLYEFSFTQGAEIGVESGEYSYELLNRNPLLKLYSIDAWQAHRAYRDHTRQEKFDQFYQNTVDALKSFGERSVIVREYSMDAVKRFQDRTLDFVYIDANHKFVEVANDLHHWAKKVRMGGIVAGHDYTKYRDLEVELHIPYVLEGFTQAYQIKPWFVIGGNVDKVKSWFFVQQLQ